MTPDQFKLLIDALMSISAGLTTLATINGIMILVLIFIGVMIMIRS